MPAPAGLWVNSAYVQRGKWLAIGTTLSSGASFDWFCREVLDGQEDSTREQLSKLASASVEGSQGILFLPYLQGERTPIWDPKARGIFFGLSISTSRSDLARSVLEGTAFALRAVVESFEVICRTKIVEIRAVGGGTRSSLWNQIKSDVLGVPLSVLKFQDTGVLGAALLAGVGCSLFSSVSEAARMVRTSDKGTRVEPTPSARQRYDEAYSLFKDLYSRTRDIAHLIADRQRYLRT
jgi:xylulokinase